MTRPIIDPTLEQLRFTMEADDLADLRDAWEGLHMIREAIETHMPAGGLPSMEHTGVKQAEKRWRS